MTTVTGPASERSTVRYSVADASPGHAEPQKVSYGARYFTPVRLDKEERWRARVLLDGSEGGGELTAEVDATPDGTIGPIALALYLMPFLAVGLLWLKAVMRRREQPG